jgi:23S rRNA pseudouridine1911/1915/1917 synthase
MSEHLTITIDGGPARLDKALAEACPDLSRSRLKALILDGQVTRNGKPATDPSAKVAHGDEIVVHLPPPLPAEPEGQDIPLDVVFEDEYLIVINKPAGLVVHPAPGNPDKTLVNALIAHCGESLKGIGGVARPGIVHRLDKETSGLMVAAKTAKVHEALSDLFAARDITRSYIALVRGGPTPRKGTIKGNIDRSRHNRKKMAVVRDGGRHAVTHYEVKKSYGPAEAPWASLTECRLETGRTHQIRVHLAHIGHPVVGDPLYGSGMKLKGGKAAPESLKTFPRQALHAAELGFIHPVSHEQLHFTSDAPDDFASLIKDLEGA